MATNLGINDHLVDEVHKLSGKKTKREAVNEALQEYVNRRKQVAIADLFGRIDFDPDALVENRRVRRQR